MIDQGQKSVFLKLGGMGDLLMLSPALRAYRKAFPDDQIHFIVGKSNESVIAGNPHIDSIRALNDRDLLGGSVCKKILGAVSLLKTLRSIEADRIFVLHRDWRWNLIAFLSGIRKRYGFARDFDGAFLSSALSTSAEEHETEKYLNLLSLRAPIKNDGWHMDLAGTQNNREPNSRIQDFFGQGKVVAIAAGGASNTGEQMPSRRWPLNYYREIIKKLLEINEIKIALFGGAGDKNDKLEPIGQDDRILNLSGQTTIPESKALLEKSSVLLTHDCGPMHLGAAAAIPVISLFGPTYPPEKIPRTNSKSLHFWKGEKLPCSPCYSHGKFPDCHHQTCMRDIAVEEVYQAVKKMLKIS